MPKILIQFAHPMLEKSRVQRALLERAQSVPTVTVRDLYEEYPDFDIDVPFEQSLLRTHEIVVLQHPFYWYSCPALMKQWIDLVLEHGWAYGRKGKALVGKKLMNVISMGGGTDAYKETGLNRYRIREFLRPFEQTARLCNMTYLPPFLVQGTHRASEPDIAQSAADYATLLEGLAKGSFDLKRLAELDSSNLILPPADKKGA